MARPGPIGAAQRRARKAAKAAYSRVRGRGRGRQAVLAVLGCQRSGTTALMQAFELDWRAKVFPEFSSLNEDPPDSDDGARFGIRLRSLEEVATLVGREPYPFVVCKPLVESQRAKAIMEAIPDARCLWMFRHYRDVAESIPRTWPDDVHQRNLRPIIEGDPNDWRSEVVADDVRELVRQHYAEDMAPHDGGALFWYVRNRLLFDLELTADERVMVLQYERFAAEPEAEMKSIYAFAGARFPGPRVTGAINAIRVGRGEGTRLHPELEQRCAELWRRLVAAAQNSANRHR